MWTAGSWCGFIRMGTTLPISATRACKRMADVNTFAKAQAEKTGSSSRSISTLARSPQPPVPAPEHPNFLRDSAVGLRPREFRACFGEWSRHRRGVFAAPYSSTSYRQDGTRCRYWPGMKTDRLPQRCRASRNRPCDAYTLRSGRNTVVRYCSASYGFIHSNRLSATLKNAWTTW
jgi:hypothetical protein